MTYIQSCQSLQLSVIVIGCDLMPADCILSSIAPSLLQSIGEGIENVGQGLVLRCYIIRYLDALTLLISTQYYVVAWAI